MYPIMPSRSPVTKPISHQALNTAAQQTKIKTLIRTKEWGPIVGTFNSTHICDWWICLEIISSC